MVQFRYDEPYLYGDPQFTYNQDQVPPVEAGFTTTSLLQAEPRRFASPSFTSNSTLTADPRPHVGQGSTFATSSALSATGSVTVVDTAVFATSSILGAEGTRNVGAATFTTTSTLSATGLYGTRGDAVFTSTSSLTVVAIPGGSVVAEFTTTSTLTATGEVYKTPVIYDPGVTAAASAQRRAARWRYVFADLMTDRTIGEFDIANARFDERISAPGSFSGSLPITDARAAERARQITEVRTVVYVYRGTQIWGGPYILWQVTPASSGRAGVSLSLQGAGLESYFARREIRANLTFNQVDQHTIARSLVTTPQARAEGDIRVQVGSNLSGVLRDRNYMAADGATFGQRLSELSAVRGSFEYRFISYVDPATGQRVRAFIVATPTFGQQNADHVFTDPGDITSWSYQGDGTRGATSFRARGDALLDASGQPLEPLMSDVVERVDLLAQGWPLLDRTDDHSSVVLKPTLDAYAQEYAATRGGSARVMAVSIRIHPGMDSFNPGNLGDRARLIIRNQWFGTFTKSWRVVGMEVTPNTRGSGQDLATLIFETEDEDFA